jgi:hypothetical protein
MDNDLSKAPGKETIAFLIGLDPPFEAELEIEDPEELNHHRVMMIFAPYFAANQHLFSVKQLRRLGEWINAAVSMGGELENAVSTCFLEHARQLKINRTLAPYLSALTKGGAKEN